MTLKLLDYTIEGRLWLEEAAGRAGVGAGLGHAKSLESTRHLSEEAKGAVVCMSQGNRG